MNHDEPTPDAFDRELDDRLRAAFAPPPAAAFARVARSAVTGPIARRWPRAWPWLLAAAALLVTALLVLQRPRGPEGHSGYELGAMWAAAYEHAVADGFGEGACCAPDVDLARLCEEKFGPRLGLVPGTVTLLGCYCGDQPIGGCMALLARTNGAPVAVYVLPGAHDPRPVLPAGSTLELARRELGPLVLYAVSRSASAATLAGFVVP